MITIKDRRITDKDIDILNTAVQKAFEEARITVASPSIKWTVQILDSDNLTIPVITGLMYNGDNTSISHFITVKASCIANSRDIQLEAVTIDAPGLDSPLNYQLSPLHEMYILAAVESSEEPRQKREPHSQLSACSKLIQEMYNDDPDYDYNMPVPKVFFSKLDFDTYMSNVSVTLEESILLWMESTGRLSVNMDDEGILVPTVLTNDIKRVYMHGAARNQVRVELQNGDIREFRNMPASAQVEICNEILSILPDIC